MQSFKISQMRGGDGEVGGKMGEGGHKVQTYIISPGDVIYGMVT